MIDYVDNERRRSRVVSNVQIGRTWKFRGFFPKLEFWSNTADEWQFESELRFSVLIIPRVHFRVEVCS